MSTGISTRTAPRIKSTQIRLLVLMRKASIKSQENIDKDKKILLSVNLATLPPATALGSLTLSHKNWSRRI